MYVACTFYILYPRTTTIKRNLSPSSFFTVVLVSFHVIMYQMLLLCPSSIYCVLLDLKPKHALLSQSISTSHLFTAQKNSSCSHSKRLTNFLRLLFSRIFICYGNYVYLQNSYGIMHTQLHMEINKCTSVCKNLLAKVRVFFFIIFFISWLPANKTVTNNHSVRKVYTMQQAKE